MRVIENGIGPWIPSHDGSYLVRRDRPSGEWPAQGNAWSSEKRISVRPRSPVRITLVGESVARGYLLEPTASLASLLNDAIALAGYAQDIEVIDLAANNLSLANALTLCRAAIELGSTIVVLYVGNNFVRSVPWPDDEIRSWSRRPWGLGAYQEYLARRSRAIASGARYFSEAVAELSSAAEVPFVTVIPGANLLDWRSRWIAPTWLPANRMARWMSTYRRLSAIERGSKPGGSSDTLLELANQLVEADGGTTPRPLEIVGQLTAGQEKDESLRILNRALSLSADPVYGDRRCPPEVADELRRIREAGRGRIVDVPAGLCASPTGAFGRRTFLDYCHHTVTSLWEVAQDVVEGVLSVAGLEAGGRQWRTVAPASPPRDTAEICLLSALHNQHWGQSGEVVEHWIGQALQADPSCITSLDDYFRASAGSAPFWLSRGVFTSNSSRLSWYLRNYSSLAVLDSDFAGRVLKLLPGRISRSMQTRLSLTWLPRTVEAMGQVNLLQPFWRERDGPVFSSALFARERSLTTRFGFVTAGEAAIFLDLVLSVGRGLPDGTFELFLNGRRCYTGLVGTDWTRHDLVLTEEVLRAGTNELAFHWPAGARSAESQVSVHASRAMGPEHADLVRIGRMTLSIQHPGRAVGSHATVCGSAA